MDTHDRYDSDVLKTLQRIANSLEKIIDNDVEISRLLDEYHKAHYEIHELQKRIKLMEDKMDDKMNYVMNIVGGIVGDDEEEDWL